MRLCLVGLVIRRRKFIFDRLQIIVSVSKKQIRIANPDEIKRRIGEFMNQEISLVLSNGTVIFGTLQKVEPDRLVISNMRQRKVTTPIALITEVFTDVDA